jgi:hypothetical protein
MRLARTLFIIFIVFTICWTPYAIIVVADVRDDFSQELHIFSILIAHTNSSLNSILYGLSDRNFRDSYMYLLGIKYCRKTWFNKGMLINYNGTSQMTEGNEVQIIPSTDGTRLTVPSKMPKLDTPQLELNDVTSV